MARMKSGAKRRLSVSRSLDRVVAALAVLMVAVALLLVGFSGPSADLYLPDSRGWVYVGAVISVTTAVLVWLFRPDAKRKE